MPKIRLQVSQTVHYHKDIELSDEEFEILKNHKDIDVQFNDDLHEVIALHLDPYYDITDADEEYKDVYYQLLNDEEK